MNLPVRDFSGGITDEVYDQVYNRHQELDNMVLGADSKPITRPGSEIDEETDDNLPQGYVRAGALLNYNNSEKLFAQQIRSIFYRNPINWTELEGPTGNMALSTGDQANALSFSQWRRHIFITSDAYPIVVKVYKDETGAYQVRDAGLPALASSPIVTAGAAGVRQYVYAFHYAYQYYADTELFEDVGPVTYVDLANSAEPSATPNPITAIPALSNGLTHNWATTVIKVFIYRTIDAGVTFYKIGEVTNGTTIFSDNVSDATAQSTGAVLYTDDDTLDLDPPPYSKFVHVCQNTGYYAAVKEGTEEILTKIQQSVPGDPDSCPIDLFTEVEDELTGMSSVESKPIALCKRHIYRLDGVMDQYGRGVITPIRISDTAGCVSNLSCVQAEGKLFWAGNDGFYMTDGYNVMKISDGINKRYRAALESQSQRKRIYGIFDEENRRIIWAFQRDPGNLDNDSAIVLHLRHGVSPKSVFTTWSGTSFRPTSLAVFDGDLYRGDMLGYVLRHRDELASDPRIDTLTDAADWQRETIIWTVKSIQINFDDDSVRKMPTRVKLEAGNKTNTTVQIKAINDEQNLERLLKVIRYRSFFEWGNDEMVWAISPCVWGYVGSIEQWRRFPAGRLRTSYLQLIFTNGFAVVTNSDTLGQATVNQTNKTITLIDVTKVWPVDSVDYVITLANDAYVKEFLVTARTDTTLTVLDALSGLPVTGDYKWELKGYRKGEVLYMIGYNITYEMLSESQDTFESGQDGTNA